MQNYMWFSAIKKICCFIVFLELLKYVTPPIYGV